MVFIVIVFPSPEICIRAFERHLLVVDLLCHSNVFASICLISVLSQGAPVTGYSLPSYFTVNSALIGLPSFREPVAVSFTPPSTASMFHVLAGYGVRTSGAGLRLAFVALPSSDAVICCRQPDGTSRYENERLKCMYRHPFETPLLGRDALWRSVFLQVGMLSRSGSFR